MGRYVSSSPSGETGVHPDRIFTSSVEMLGVDLAALAVIAPVSTAIPTSGIVWFIPLKVSSAITVNSLAAAISSNGTSSQVDMGIYDSSGNSLVHSGLVSTSNTSGWQDFSITPILLAPGLYYAAFLEISSVLNCSITRWTGLTQRGHYQMTGQSTLPVTATFANPAYDFLPLICVNSGSVNL